MNNSKADGEEEVVRVSVSIWQNGVIQYLWS